MSFDALTQYMKEHADKISFLKQFPIGSVVLIDPEANENYSKEFEHHIGHVIGFTKIYIKQDWVIGLEVKLPTGKTRIVLSYEVIKLS